jgi:hypothetical protein
MKTKEVLPSHIEEENLNQRRRRSEKKESKDKRRK